MRIDCHLAGLSATPSCLLHSTAHMQVIVLHCIKALELKPYRASGLPTCYILRNLLGTNNVKGINGEYF